MSKEQFDLKKAIIEAIPDKEVKYPDMPVDVALQEAEDLYVWCQADKDLLIKAGLKWPLVEDLPARTGALRFVQSQWQKDFRSQEEVQKEWAEKSPVAYDLRDELVHHCYHAFYNANDLYARTQKIAEGSGHADMIQDLSDLAALGKANPTYLTAVGVDLSLFDLAETQSVQMANLLAKVNGKRMEDNVLRLQRDKAYMHFKEAIDEIRRCGQYVFWRDEQRKKGYVSKYGKSKRQIKPKNGKNAEETKK
jgi:hypothetical protein